MADKDEKTAAVAERTRMAYAEQAAVGAAATAAAGLKEEFTRCQEVLATVSMPEEVREAMIRLGSHVRDCCAACDSLPGATVSTQEYAPLAMGLRETAR